MVRELPWAWNFPVATPANDDPFAFRRALSATQQQSQPPNLVCLAQIDVEKDQGDYTERSSGIGR